MTVLSNALTERREAFQNHLGLAQALEQSLFQGDSLQAVGVTLTVRHVLTIKSGLVVHLYNIVEAIMTMAIEQIGQALLATPPSEWSRAALKEWLRHSASLENNGNEDSRLEKVHQAALVLLTRIPITDQPKLKKPPGTWSDKVIFKFSQRLNLEFRLNANIAPRIKRSERYRDMSPLEFLADRKSVV